MLRYGGRNLEAKIHKNIWLQQTQGENDGWACKTRATQFDTFYSSPDWWGNDCLRPSNAWDTLPQKQWTSMDINGHSPCEIETLMLYYIVLYHVVSCTIILVLPCEHSIGYTVMYVVNPIINHPQFTRPYHVVVLHSITIPHKSFFFSMRGLP